MRLRAAAVRYVSRQSRFRPSWSQAASDWRQIGLGARGPYHQAVAGLVEISQFRRQRNPLGKIGMDAPQQLDQLPTLLRGHPGKRLGSNFVREVEDAGEDRPGLVGQDEAAGTPVARLRLPLDPAVLLHAVDLPHQGHRLDLEQIREARLIDALVTSQIAQDLALRSG